MSRTILDEHLGFRGFHRASASACSAWSEWARIQPHDASNGATKDDADLGELSRQATRGCEDTADQTQGELTNYQATIARAQTLAAVLH